MFGIRSTLKRTSNRSYNMPRGLNAITATNAPMKLGITSGNTAPQR